MNINDKLDKLLGVDFEKQWVDINLNIYQKPKGFSRFFSRLFGKRYEFRLTNVADQLECLAGRVGRLDSTLVEKANKLADKLEKFSHRSGHIGRRFRHIQQCLRGEKAARWYGHGIWDWVADHQQFRRAKFSQSDFIKQFPGCRGVCHAWSVKINAALLKNPEATDEEVKVNGAWFTKKDVDLQSNISQFCHANRIRRDDMSRVSPQVLQTYGVQQTYGHGFGKRYDKKSQKPMIEGALRILKGSKLDSWVAAWFATGGAHAIQIQRGRDKKWHLWDSNWGKFTFQNYEQFAYAFKAYLISNYAHSIDLDRYELAPEPM